MINKKDYPNLNRCTIAIIGLGYVGLPLALEFSKTKKCNITGKSLNRKIIGFDIQSKRIEELKNGFDRTNEVNEKEIRNANFYKLTSDTSSIEEADVFIITVPTPIDDDKRPDLKPIKSASSIVAKALKNRSYTSKGIIPIVIYESTFYPGTTDEVCIPLIESESGLCCNESNIDNIFACGYSPERINPGDKKHRLRDIVKVTSGSNSNVAKWIDLFYGSIIVAGTHSTKDIKTAEAAKIIENTQRDINIALINELAIIFKLLNIDTLDVLEAASTKWNFLNFKPGLVGGHCIGVDPYYLTYKAQSIGYTPEIVLAGRRINDDMSSWIAEQIILEMSKKNIPLLNSKILILGFTFKENCPDIRNTKVYDLIKNLNEYDLNINIIDPWVKPKEAKEVYGLNILKNIPKKVKYDVVICAVSHSVFKERKKSEWEEIISKKGIFFDLKGILPRELNPLRI